MKIFIPLNEELLENREFAEAIIPYRPGLPAISQIPAVDRKFTHSRSRTSTSPGSTSSSAALPALSSSTYLAGPELA